MRKRNSGYVLLAFLVVSGLAGTISGSISNKERKLAVVLMKETKTAVLNSVKGLSPAQADFKPAPGRWSARECLYHIAITENELWQLFETTMKTQANPERRADIKLTDEQVIAKMEDRSLKIKTEANFEPKNKSYKTLDDAIAAFKEKREANIKYIKVTTEDMRDHIVETHLGWIDAYQLYLTIGAHADRHTQQIEEIKANVAFPR